MYKKINKKQYRFCSLCRLVSSELDDASSKKIKKRTQLGHILQKTKAKFSKIENWDDEIFTQEHYVKRQHNGAKVFFKCDFIKNLPPL